MDHPKNAEEYISVINEMFEKIPFNNVLGLKVESLGPGNVKTVFEMRDELVGNYKRRILHGGVISSALDVTGGLSAVMSIQEKMQEESIDARIERSFKISTLDLRVDFLRPGFGKRFVVTAHPLRTGNRIAVIRIELHNDQDELIAVGTGSFFFAK
ncbi:MAG: thioesterase family protein [Deltaproteobacteria bacterium]|nr:thioesterase family protein [Deltaproteobacteria bacterium]